MTENTIINTYSIRHITTNKILRFGDLCNLIRSGLYTNYMRSMESYLVYNFVRTANTGAYSIIDKQLAQDVFCYVLRASSEYYLCEEARDINNLNYSEWIIERTKQEQHMIQQAQLLFRVSKYKHEY